jgi:hypothetical protein
LVSSSVFSDEETIQNRGKLITTVAAVRITYNTMLLMIE